MDESYSDVEEIPENLDIQPYMFEPQVRVNNNANAEESSEESEEETEFDRRLNTS